MPAVIRLRLTTEEAAHLVACGVRGGVIVPGRYRPARELPDGYNWYLGRAVAAAGVPAWAYFSAWHSLAVMRLGST